MAVLRRRTGIASVTTLTGITLTLGAIHLVAPKWSHEAGLDVWNIGAALRYQQEVQATTDETNACEDRLRCQLNASDHVIDLLAAGRIPLAAAADELAVINRNRAGVVEVFRLRHPGEADRVLFARYAVSKVSRLPDGHPGRSVAVRDRLDAQLADLAGDPSARW